ncbi:MAG: ATP synthase F1 subunit gamma [Candidatus Obscuribacterales bacterium]|nr:ATP synthase F1 subunit gamma [Candidatus Obscuribacterales bacterium]
MANLKAIRRRIKSVQSTRKITRAMRMVAAAKVRRAQARTLAARPFTKTVVRMLREIVRELVPVDMQEMPLLHRRTVKKVGLIVITSDRGLCGSYNGSVLRAALERIKTLQTEGKEVKLILIGLKAATFFRSIKVEKLDGQTYTLLPAIPTVQEAKLIADNAAASFVKGDIDAVEIIGTDFINMLRSEVVNTKFLPVELPPPADDDGLSPLMLFEPTIPEVLEQQILPKYIENVIFQALLDAAASELAARMNAMSSATTNAEELINSLTLYYNRARQANITQELLEVVAGAEALRG